MTGVNGVLDGDGDRDSGLLSDEHSESVPQLILSSFKADLMLIAHAQSVDLDSSTNEGGYWKIQVYHRGVL